MQDDAKDEISLMDLFVVLLKYRKLILIPVLVTILITGIGYLIFPASVAVMVLSPAPNVSFLLPNLSISYFTQIGVLQGALEDAERGILGSDGSKNTAARQAMLPWMFSTREDPNVRVYTSSNQRLSIIEDRRTGILRFSCSGFSVETGKIFLQSLFIHGNDLLKKAVQSQAEAYVVFLEQEDLMVQNSSDFVRMQFNAVQARKFLETQIEPIVQIVEPYVDNGSLGPYHRRYIISSIIIVFAALAISVLIALLLNTIQNVRKDEEAMQKIRAALAKKDRK
jgi:hypothetical protein